MKKIKCKVLNGVVISLCLIFLLNIYVYADSNISVSHTINNTASVSKNGKRTVNIVMSNTSSDDITIDSITIDSSCDFYSEAGVNISLLDSSLSAGDTNVIVASPEIVYKGTGSRFKYTVRYTPNGGVQTSFNQIYTISVNEEKDIVYEKEYIDSSDDTEAPNIYVSADDTMDLNVVPGTEFTLKIIVKNTAGYKAKDVMLNIDLDNSIMNWAEYNGAINLGYINGNRTKTYDLKFRINENAKKGIYAIPIKSKFTNAVGDSFTNTDEIFINITNELLEPMLELKRVDYGEAGITPEVPFDLNLYLENMGGIKAKNVKIILTGLSKDGFMPQDITDTKYISSIAPNSVGVATFPLIASMGIDRGINELTMNVSYIDDNGNDYSDDMKMYLKVGSDISGLSSKSRPKIVISRYNVSDVPVKSGKVVTLNYTFTNTSSVKAINNMKVTVASEDGTFNIVGGSNSFWIESLGCKEGVSRSISLRARNDAKSNSYPVSLTFDYEDSTGENHTSKEEIYIQVVEDLKLQIGDLELPYDAMVGGTSTIGFEYFNLGKSEISNLRVEVEGDFKAKDQVNYIGNISAGDEDYSDIVIEYTKAGECSGNLVFIFEDTNGDESEIRKSLSIFVQEQMQYDDPMMGDIQMGGYIEEEKSGISRWLFMILLPIIIFAVAFVTKIIIMKIYNKKIESEI